MIFQGKELLKENRDVIKQQTHPAKAGWV